MQIIPHFGSSLRLSDSAALVPVRKPWFGLVPLLREISYGTVQDPSRNS